MSSRMYQIERFMEHPIETQNNLFQELIRKGTNTEFGLDHSFWNVNDLESYREQVPVRNYERLYPYIERILKGEQNILWPSYIRWFAKSSGTTNDRSKFIPVSKDSLDECHYKGGKDLLAIYISSNPDSLVMVGKGLVIGGSHQINNLSMNKRSYYGDLSAVIVTNLPFWSQLMKTPPTKVALMGEWEEKINKMVEITSKEDVTSIFGVPTWTVVLIQRILDNTGANSILDVWPNLELFVHGAVSFTPYRSLFKELIPTDKMNYLETYNASEGFFGIQDRPDSDDMLLMLDYGIFYEFIPISELENENPNTISLEEVEVGKNYALVITTNSGLWRYKIGDTVKFTSKYPFRIKITGRTRHFINAFGEELIIENAEQGITQACEKTGAIIGDYTAGPRYLGMGKKGGHEWIIEFKRPPGNFDRFINELDKTLRDLNSDYDAKRYKDMALEMPVIHAVKEGTFYDWMKNRDKLGGQNKVPRLVNSREYLDDILKLVNEKDKFLEII
ncbi:GH3 auxin-responsive promoter family protein [Bacteroidota bacterium]